MQGTQAAHEDPANRIGLSIGSYQITRLIGRGGMGAVYEARSEARRSAGSDRVAVKFLYDKFTADRENVRRFVNEARTAIRVRHPNLVDVIESGELPSGAPYVMMEYLEGETLGARLRRLGRLPLHPALTVASEVAAALAFAHGRGIVHRDLKPDNIFLFTPPGSSGERVKVLDFGIAKVLTGGDGDLVTMVRTKTGAILGTPTYMSPEQCRGAERVVDRSDVYSLGLVLYEMLAGHPPFVGVSPGELLVKHILDEPPPLGRLVPGLPRDVAELVHHLLQKEVQARPDMLTVHGWLAALADPKAPRPVLPFLTLKPTRARRTRRIVLAAAVVGLVLLLLAGAGLRYRTSRRAASLPIKEAAPLADMAPPGVSPPSPQGVPTAIAPTVITQPTITLPVVEPQQTPRAEPRPPSPSKPPRERPARKKPAPAAPPSDDDQVKPVY